MLDMKIDHLIRLTSRIDNASRNTGILKRAGEITSQFSLAGRTGSPAHLDTMCDAFAEELRDRQIELSKAVERVCRAHRLASNESNITYLNSLAAEILEQEFTYLFQELQKTSVYGKLAPEDVIIHNQRFMEGKMHRARTLAIAKIEQDIAILMAELANTPQSPSAVNVTGNQNNVFMGAVTNSNIKINQNITQIENTLTELSRKIESLPDTPGFRRTDVLEIISLIRDEVRTPEPRRSAIRMMLGGMKTTLEAAGALPGIYELLRQLAILTGHPDLLPPLG